MVSRDVSCGGWQSLTTIGSCGLGTEYVAIICMRYPMSCISAPVCLLIGARRAAPICIECHNDDTNGQSIALKESASADVEGRECLVRRIDEYR